MNAYECLQQLEEDLEYARDNPHDEEFFSKMVFRYKNSTEQVQELLKSALFDRMLEHNPLYMFEKVAEENPQKVIYYNSTQDPFFHV